MGGCSSSSSSSVGGGAGGAVGSSGLRHALGAAFKGTTLFQARPAAILHLSLQQWRSRRSVALLAGASNSQQSKQPSAPSPEAARPAAAESEHGCSGGRALLSIAAPLCVGRCASAAMRAALCCA